MTKDNAIVLFHQKTVRRHWDETKELWYFSVVDVVEILTETKRLRKYWSDLKKKLADEGSEVSDKTGQLRNGLLNEGELKEFSEETQASIDAINS